MTDLAVIVPTRGRPQNIRRLCEAWVSTGARASLYLGVDDDDDSLDVQTCIAWGEEFDIDLVLESAPRTNMCGALNSIAVKIANSYSVVSFMGDDHLPRTPRWDQRMMDALIDRPGVAYGNDLMQRAALPTSVFMTSDIIQTLGYMAPPQLHHLFIDNSWRDWGEGIGSFHYLDDVVIEHLHPQAGGKAEWDEGYVRVNGGEMWEHDAEAYRVYREDQEPSDIERLKAL
jgi:hypothetical protein